MKINKALFLFLFLVLTLIPYAFASEEDTQVSLSDFPAKLQQALDLPSLFAGQLLATAILMALFMFPTMVLTRNPYALLFVGFATLCFTIAVGWQSYYLLIILTFAVAGMFASKMKNIFT